MPEWSEDDSDLLDATGKKTEKWKNQDQVIEYDKVGETETEKVTEKESDIEKSEEKSLKRRREQTKISIDSFFEKVGKKGRRKVRCKVCFENPDVVQAHKKANRRHHFELRMVEN